MRGLRAGSRGDEPAREALTEVARATGAESAPAILGPNRRAAPTGTDEGGVERSMTTREGSPTDTGSRERAWLSSGWVIAGFALVLLLVLGWRFLADPSLSAPTRDPAWYTWRVQVVTEGDPGAITSPNWGPSGLFSGGYRVSTLVSGALLQRVAGIDRYSFSAFFMLGMPILTGLALGAGAFRSRKDGSSC